MVILGSYTLALRVGGVLLSKKLRDVLSKRKGTLEMRLAFSPQVVAPEILHKTDWPFAGAQALAYFFARLAPFVFVLFCVLVFVFRHYILDLLNRF